MFGGAHQALNNERRGTTRTARGSKLLADLLPNQRRPWLRIGGTGIEMLPPVREHSGA